MCLCQGIKMEWRVTSVLEQKAIRSRPFWELHHFVGETFASCFIYVLVVLDASTRPVQGSLNKDGNREKRGPHRSRGPSTQCVKVKSALYQSFSHPTNHQSILLSTWYPKVSHLATQDSSPFCTHECCLKETKQPFLLGSL